MTYPKTIRNCTLKVDLEYPKELHDVHNNYPLAPESVVVSGMKKLIPKLRSKKNYVLHHKNLHQYLKHGMELTKIHRGVAYSENMFLKEYISNSTESRKLTKNDFEKDFFKLMNNSVFGKTLENVRARSKIMVVNGHNEKKLLGLVAAPNFRGAHTFENSELVSVNMGNSTVTLDKPIYLGQAILDVSKTLMYSFHYKYVKLKNGTRTRLLFTDTDSLFYRFQTEDFYKDIAEDVPKWFDTSKYPEEHPAGLPRTNKKKFSE